MKQFVRSTRRSLLLSLGTFATTCAFGQGAAGVWPERVVRIINPYAAGGPSDTIVRLLAEGLSNELGQRFIVENKAGGGTVIGAGLVAKSAPDGYTFLMATVAPLVVQPAINAALPYDAHRDFELVAMFATVPNLITVHPSVPIRNVKELISHARKHPGALNYASAGAGTGPHLGGELFSRMANVELTHVPYAGAAPAVLGVLGGQVQVSFVNITPQLPHVKSGKLRPIAIGSRTRSSLLPEVPTVAESGLAGYVSESWNGIAAPAGTPKLIVDKLHRAIVKVMSSPKAQETLATLGAESTVMGPEAFAAYVKTDEKQLVPIIRSLGLTPNN
ncbi:Bug family tripartite tricarboxylate transporter substrate binding protein [Azohydromonas australica]|uniref:Bug family tripartite tricarboxylate transporter substrate binding protein n=1 Tax=Azohydromonas australica TaxID=364039 RepID=UPI00049104A2|nr:tripartite tricarboxylate transporter substrate binding protein [Azohydromonas australica]